MQKTSSCTSISTGSRRSTIWCCMLMSKTDISGDMCVLYAVFVMVFAAFWRNKE